MEIYPIWPCPHHLFKIHVKTNIYREPGFEDPHRQGDTKYAQMYTYVEIYYTKAYVFHEEAFNAGEEVVRRMEKRLIENHGFHLQYVV